MSRLAPTKDTIRTLFALSGNECAFPGCAHRLINAKNQFVAQVCHIHAALPGGERYAPEQSTEDRRHPDNLILLCYAHHVETNDVDAFPASRLRAIKQEHEARFRDLCYAPPEPTLARIAEEVETYWTKIGAATERHPAPDFAVYVDTTASFDDVAAQLADALVAVEHFGQFVEASDQRALADLETLVSHAGLPIQAIQDIPYWKNPFIRRHWEGTALLLPSALVRARVHLQHLLVLHLIAQRRLMPESQDIADALSTAHAELIRLAGSAGIPD